jgi:hypothetical protein
VGVEGISSSGIGVEGISSGGIGVYGYSSTDLGVYAYCNSSWALEAYSPSSYAGVFFGPVYIGGNFVATGTKSAAVKADDGSYRLMYALETPENMFEDVGSASLKGGHASVSLDSVFAGVIKNDKYHVFLSASGETNGLFVSKKTPTGFEVTERNGGTSSTDFSYRLVAHRKDTTSRGRMEKIDLPQHVDRAKAGDAATPDDRHPKVKPDNISAPNGPHKP